MTVLILSISRLEFELPEKKNTCLIFGDKVSNQKYPLFANNVVL